MKPQAVLFDLDGTLVNTAPDLTSAVNHVLNHYQKPSTTIEKIRPFISLGTIAILAEALGFKRDDPRLPQLRQELFNAYQPILAKDSHLYAGLDLLLAKLKQAGIPWGIVTNKPAWLAKPIIEQLNLKKDCAVLIGAESAGISKPNPEGLLLAARHLHLAPQKIAYVGDCAHDMLAAQNAQMRAVAVTWGYYLPDSPPETWDADVTCKTVEELEHELL